MRLQLQWQLDFPLAGCLCLRAGLGHVAVSLAAVAAAAHDDDFAVGVDGLRWQGLGPARGALRVPVVKSVHRCVLVWLGR